jgi:hypothetical protein
VNRPAQANERLIREADEARERAKKRPLDPERDALLKKARQAEITQGWLSASELKPPDQYRSGSAGPRRLVASIPERSIDRCAPDLQGFGDFGCAHAVNFHFLDLRRSDPGQTCERGLRLRLRQFRRSRAVESVHQAP